MELSKINLNYPKNYEYENGNTNLLIEKKTGRFAKLISNFGVKVNNITIQEDFETKKTTIVEIIFYLPTNEQKNISINLEDIDKFEYQQVSPFIIFGDELSTKKCKEHIANIIRYQSIKYMEKFEYYIEEYTILNKLGWNKIYGNHIYVAGDTIIGDEKIIKNLKVDEKISSRYKLEVDENLSEYDALLGALDMYNITAPVSNVVFSCFLIGLMRQLFIDANVVPKSTFFIVGDTQTQKTSLVKLLTCLYNRKSNPDLTSCQMHITSTNKAVEKVTNSLYDTTFLYDDLYYDNDRATRKSNEKHLTSLIRSFADNTARATNSSNDEINSQLIVTSEYIPKCVSNLGRLYIVDIMYDYEDDEHIHSIDLRKLKQCQDNHLVLSTFAKYFLRYISENYEHIVKYIQDIFSRYRNLFIHDENEDENDKDNEVDSNYNRLDDICYIISIAIKILDDYVDSVNKFNKSENHKELKIKLKKTIKYLCKISRYQKEILKQSKQQDNYSINLCQKLLEIIDIDNTLGFAENNNIFIEDNTLFLNPYYFIQLLNKHQITNKDGEIFTYNQIVKYFRARHIIKLKYNNLNTFRKYNHYYSALSIKKLKNEAENNYFYRINKYLK